MCDARRTVADSFLHGLVNVTAFFVGQKERFAGASVDIEAGYALRQVEFGQLDELFGVDGTVLCERGEDCGNDSADFFHN